MSRKSLTCGGLTAARIGCTKESPPIEHQIRCRLCLERESTDDHSAYPLPWSSRRQSTMFPLQQTSCVERVISAPSLGSPRITAIRRALSSTIALLDESMSFSRVHKSRNRCSDGAVLFTPVILKSPAGAELCPVRIRSRLLERQCPGHSMLTEPLFGDPSRLQRWSLSLLPTSRGPIHVCFRV